MKKYLISLALLSALALPVFALAQGQPAGGATLDSLVNGIKTAAWTIFGAVAVIAFVVAGILFLTAAGNPEKIQQARNAFLWGVAGVVVGILAYSIISIVQTATNLH
jgi:hypothetical protein